MLPVRSLSLRLGCDLLYMPRLKDKIENQAFLDRILTENEKSLYAKCKTEKRKLEFLCGRFAAKEAFSKAKGTGIGKVDFLDFEVLSDELGKPVSNLGEVSISHDEDYAMAVVILYEEI